MGHKRWIDAILLIAGQDHRFFDVGGNWCVFLISASLESSPDAEGEVMARRKRKRVERYNRRARRTGIGVPLGKWLKGPFRIRKNGRGYLVDFKVR